MEVSPESHPVSQLEFDVIIGADGRRNTLPGTTTKSASLYPERIKTDEYLSSNIMSAFTSVHS